MAVKVKTLESENEYGMVVANPVLADGFRDRAIHRERQGSKRN